MMKKRQTILSGGIVCLLIAVAWGLYLYNKPHANAGSKSTDASLSADSLYNAYSANETSANKSFMNKILEVSGKVEDITMSGHRAVVLLSTTGMGRVNCEMAVDSAEVFGTLHKQQQVIIKGKCSGYLMDVNLVDCVINK